MTGQNGSEPGDGLARTLPVATEQQRPDGLFYRAAVNEHEAMWGLRYILQQIEGTNSYRPNIGQTHLATSSLRIAIDTLAKVPQHG